MAVSASISARERRNYILAVLSDHGSVQAEELGNQLHVSLMTVHRDLNALAEQRRLRKVHGGAVQLEPDRATECTFCHGSVPDSHTRVVLHLADGTLAQACCAHCGLLSMMAVGDRVASALVTDFLQGRSVGARMATYVIDPALQICCSPTMLAFADRSSAERFCAGFGGNILTFDEAIELLRGQMWH